MNGEREMLRPADVASLLGVTKGRVYQLIAARELPAIRVGGALRIPRAAWEAWLRRRSREALGSLSLRGGTPANPSVLQNWQTRK
jgi:excisionase family DNA binding protein